MTREEEQNLVRDAQKSLGAFNKLYEYYLPIMFRYIVNRVANKDIAEDLTSQTFLKALKKLNSFDNSRSFGAWLYTIAHNNIIDFYRKSKEYQINVEVLQNFLSSDDSPEKKAEKAELTKNVIEVLKQLPPAYQEVLTLRFLEEKGNEEIAEILGCTTNNVNVKIHRALKCFEKYLEKNTKLLELIK